MRPRLVASGICEEGCISSYGTFGVQGPLSIRKQILPHTLENKNTKRFGGVKTCVLHIAAERRESRKKL